MDQQIEKIRQITFKDNDLRDSRISRLEKQVDTITTQLGQIALDSHDIKNSTDNNHQQTHDFIARFDKYLERHDLEHAELRSTDEKLKQYLFMALGAVGILSFMAPYIWSFWRG